jgi:hypothetical protein
MVHVPIWGSFDTITRDIVRERGVIYSSLWFNVSIIIVLAVIVPAAMHSVVKQHEVI